MKISLKQVWEEVGIDYNAGLINSESCLQAVLYKVLREHINDDSDRKVFVEPVLEYYESGSPKFKPDIIICDGKIITAIMELKYAPNWDPIIKRDLEKLNDLSNKDKADKKYYAGRIPRTGEWTKKEFEVTPTTVFIIAVIGKYYSKSVNYDKLVPIIEKMEYFQRFCLMTGRIYGEEREPEFIIYGSVSEIP